MKRSSCLQSTSCKAVARRWCTVQSFATVLGLLAAPLSCAAQQGQCTSETTQVSITPGFFTGANLNSLSDDQLGMYAAGYVDALQAATMIGVAESSVVVRCRPV